MSTEKTKDEMAVLGCIAVFAALPLGSMLNGYVLSILWGWFMVPIFHFPVLHVAQAIGVSMVTHMLTHQDVPVDKDRKWYMPLVLLFTYPAMALAIGWIVRQWT